MPKYKNKVTKWPCGVCGLSSESDFSILCEICVRWYHTKCESISEKSAAKLEQLENAPYICKQCRSESGGEIYDYGTAVMRLAQSAKRSYKHFVECTIREEHFLRQNFNIENKPSTYCQTTHWYSKKIMDENGIEKNKRPLVTTGDGSCLFNAVSIVLTGTEARAIELRLRTCVEMVKNKKFYTTHPLSDVFNLVSPDYDKACKDCATVGCYSSAWTVMALANVVCRRIEMIYPPVNGSRDLYSVLLTKSIKPLVSNSDDYIWLLWTRVCESPIGDWIPDHFVPLVEDRNRLFHSTPQKLEIANHCEILSTKEVSMIRPSNDTDSFIDVVCMSTHGIETTDEIIKSFRPPDKCENRATKKLFEDNLQSHFSDRNENTFHYPEENSLNMGRNTTEVVKKKSLDFQGDIDFNNKERKRKHDFMQNEIEMSEETTSESQDDTDLHPRKIKRKNGKPNVVHVKSIEDNLKIATGERVMGRFFTPEQLYFRVTDQSKVFSGRIPLGGKSNYAFFVNNSRGISNTRNFVVDDCGVWDSKKSGSIRSIYYIKNGKFCHIRQKMGKYFKQRVKNGEKMQETIHLADDDLVVLYRYYSCLRRCPEFKRRVSWFDTIQGTKVGASKTVVEYMGSQPSTPSHYANIPGREYVRTPKHVTETIDERLRCNEPTRKIYREMVLNDSTSSPRDFKQVRNRKMKLNKGENSKSTKYNIADEVLDVLNMINTNPYVKEIILTPEKPPSIILYTGYQLADLQSISIQSSDQTIIGVDRTFNIAACYATTIVFKHYKVIKNDTDDSPIFLGPVYLHWDASFETYCRFFSHLSARLSNSQFTSEIRINIGSDNEKALTKAIDHCFPNANRFLCTKHLKENLRHHLREKTILSSKQRSEVYDLFFSENGVVFADSLKTFNNKVEIINNKIADHEDLQKYLSENFLPALKEFVIKPLRMKHLKNCGLTIIVKVSTIL
uniref:uncharacterized protein LOC120335330 n=1 Tax=Styela clava TaxID=7725 RepID=UPI00193AD983|nr:uncharacterized protein LOC120335330 [Styela clava]